MPATAPKVDTDQESRSRFVVGIDLGTTNCAVGYIDTEVEPWQVEILDIPQWVEWGQVEKRKTLPSFLYQPEKESLEAVKRGLPWETSETSSIVGVLARDAGLRHPGRRIGSAKSWLCHDGVDRTASILPWNGDPDVTGMSPVEASARYLGHLRDAWNHRFPESPLAEQDVVITLPASFDEVARELTIRAAKQAGLPRVYLIEEPQAAFYAWIDHHRDTWFEQVHAGQMILVCDVGGGTSDFTLIRVRPAGEDSHQVQFHRVAVGKHLILGGDNLDLALARFLEPRFAEGGSLAPRDWDRLIQVCRNAKEAMLCGERPESFTVALPSEGSRLIGGLRTTEISAAEIDQVLLDGFFPMCQRDAVPSVGATGFREFGLPYAEDPAMTRHLAEFLRLNARAGIGDAESEAAIRPDFVLFNGGVMNGDLLQERIIACIGNWFSEGSSWTPTILGSAQLDLAVAQGAAYFGMVRRGKGVRIAANLGRSYYMQVAQSPPETLCLIPGAAEPGQTFSPEAKLELELDHPVQFPLWVSSTRLADQAGTLTAIQQDQLSPLPPIRTVIKRRGSRRESGRISVRIETTLTEIGTLAMYCVEEGGGQRWKLEFDIRSTLETDRHSHLGTGEAAGIIDAETVDACSDVLCATFDLKSIASGKYQKIGPSKVISRLREAAQADRGDWTPWLLRQMSQNLLENEAGRKQSEAHEARWLNLLGYCLRPGYGVAADDWRVGQVWKTVFGKLSFATPASRNESLILWRRVAGGLTSGQQQQLFAANLSMIVNRGGGKRDLGEPGELWRMFGSLENLTIPQKTELLKTAVELLSKRTLPPYSEAVIWAIGRIGNRVPAYGPLNSVIPPNMLHGALELLRSGDDSLGLRHFSLFQLSQRTGDRFRDITPQERERTKDWLEKTGAPTKYLEKIESPGDFDRSEQEAMFGESLPLGIRLIR